MSILGNVEEATERHAIKCELFAEALRLSGKAQLRVLGTSMMPAVRPGDLLTVTRVEITDAAAGEIVLFASDRRLFAHRVREKASRGEKHLLITQGDRLSGDDAAISNCELLGRVTSIVRGTSTIIPSPLTTLGGRILAVLSRYSEWPVQILLSFHTMRYKTCGGRWEMAED